MFYSSFLSGSLKSRKSSFRRRFGLFRDGGGRQEVAGEGQGGHEREVSFKDPLQSILCPQVQPLASNQQAIDAFRP